MYRGNGMYCASAQKALWVKIRNIAMLSSAICSKLEFQCLLCAQLCKGSRLSLLERMLLNCKNGSRESTSAQQISAVSSGLSLRVPCLVAFTLLHNTIGGI